MKKQRRNDTWAGGKDELPRTAAGRGWLPGCCVPIWDDFVINSDISTLLTTDLGLSDPHLRGQ